MLTLGLLPIEIVDRLLRLGIRVVLGSRGGRLWSDFDSRLLTGGAMGMVSVADGLLSQA